MPTIVGWHSDSLTALAASGMKDQYVGDINDFVKYRLLRAVSPAFDSLVVAWMLTEPDARTDGRRIEYLRDPVNRGADPELFDALSTIVHTDERNVEAVERSGVLPTAVFESTPMPTDPAARSDYFKRVVARATPDSLVFLDPDNGLEVPSAPKGRRGCERYLYWDELGVIGDAGASVVIYQHFPRVSRPRFVAELLSRLQAEVGPDYGAFAAYSSQVAFLLAVRRSRAGQARRAVERLCAVDGIPLTMRPWRARSAAGNATS